MALFLTAYRGEDGIHKDSAAAVFPFYIRGACFWQNFFTDRAKNVFALVNLSLLLAFLLSVLFFPLALFIVIPLIIASIVQLRIMSILKKKASSDGVYNSAGGKQINCYLRLPKQLQKELKPLAKHAYKYLGKKDERKAEFWAIITEYEEIYPPPEVPQPLDEIIQTQKLVLEEMKKAYPKEIE